MLKISLDFKSILKCWMLDGLLEMLLIFLYQSSIILPCRNYRTSLDPPDDLQVLTMAYITENALDLYLGLGLLDTFE